MGWFLLAERPSIVTTVLARARQHRVTHERTALPLIWTVHAPHSAMPQPNFVPVSPSVSRKTQNSGMSAGSVDRLGLAIQIEFQGCHVLSSLGINSI